MPKIRTSLELRTPEKGNGKHRPPKQELLQRERLRGVLEMAGAVCHELNQPIQAILMYCALMLRDTSPDSETYAYLNKMQKQLYRIGEVTRKLTGITTYETKEYVEGMRIIDIDKASRSGESPLPAEQKRH